jgi:hypothetical protein
MEDWVNLLMTQGVSLSLLDHAYVGDLREEYMSFFLGGFVSLAGQKV